MWMKNEEKNKPNYQRVEEAMQAIFADRRKLIITEAATVTEVKEVYPWLSKKTSYYRNFKGLMVIPQTSLLEEGLKKYGEGIIIYVKGLKKTKMFEDRVANIASEKESARKESVQHAAIVGVPVMFNEKVEHIIVCEDEMETTDLPVFIMQSGVECHIQYEIGYHIQYIQISTADTYLAAFAHYLAAFYCLNLAYPACLRKTLHFFSESLLTSTIPCRLIKP
ncbi:uncharacterized protein [Apostichopus japonicus]|uniref:uncharacterized protein n=1 Tax=Stichopus japonicus TaxID=307972 RepID=UPI003AB712CC